MDTSNRPPIEPSAELRQFASNLRQIFIALRAEGFTEGQTLVLIGHMFAASAQGGQQQ